MSGRKWIIGGLSLLLLSLATAISMADRLTLKDGTVLEGKVIKQADQYWIKTADGESRIVPATEVSSYQKTPPPGATPEPPPKSETPAPAAPTPTPHGTTVAPPKAVEPAKPAAPTPPPQVTISVPATNTASKAVATGVKLTQGEQFIVNPNPTDMWGKGVGNHQGKKCDYKGYTDRPGWMSLACKVGDTGVAITAGKPAEAPQAGELFLFCSDTDADKNVGEIHVTIIGPLPPTLASIKVRIDAVEKAAQAVAIWQEYLSSHPVDPDLSQAKSELAKWIEMANGGGEKINGKWVSGDEHKALMDKVKGLVKEAMGHFQKNETLQAVKQMEEAQTLYPNSFFVNFFLGFMALNQDDLDKAMPLFDRANKLHPKSPEVIANIGVIHFKKKDFENGLTEMQQAAEIADSEEIALDLNIMVHKAPDSLKGSQKLKDATSAAKLLASKYSLPPIQFLEHMQLQPVWMIQRGGGEDGPPPPGAQASGTGFVINSAEGLILTNRHVAKNGKSYEITLQGGEKMPATVVVIDDEQDLAILKVNSPKPLTAIKFADHDTPGDGAECTVIGFPLGDRYTTAAKVTHGIVTTGHANTDGADVMIDAKVNPGNSGGPILDQAGNVMAIVCMKTLSSETEDTYGLGISAGKIRKFLDKNKIKVEKATGRANTKKLSTEDIAAKIEPITVLIVTTF